MKNDEYDVSIDVLNLSTRASNTLKGYGDIRTIGELLKHQDNLHHIRNMGKITLGEINMKLAMYFNENMKYKTVSEMQTASQTLQQQSRDIQLKIAEHKRKIAEHTQAIQELEKQKINCNAQLQFLTNLIMKNTKGK